MHVKCENIQKKDVIDNENKILEALGLRRIHPSCNLNNLDKRKTVNISANTDDTILEKLGLERTRPSLDVISSTESLEKNCVDVEPEEKLKRKKSVISCKEQEIAIVEEPKESMSEETPKENPENMFSFVKVEQSNANNNNESKLGNKNIEKPLKTKRTQGKPKHKMCRICSMTFPSLAKLRKHREDIHSSRKPYCCSKCDSRFINLDELLAHTRIHAGKMPYSCNTCKEHFEDKAQHRKHLVVHELKKMPSVKKLTCEFCSKVFSKPSDLERHRRVHTGEKPFACMICNKRFQQAYNLTKHLQIHTREKHFQCEICSKIFGRSDVLNRHMLIHSVHKPFACSSCHKSFNRNLQLSKHIERHHPQKASNTM